MLEEYEKIKNNALDYLKQCIECAKQMQDIEVARQLEVHAHEIRTLRFNIAVVGDIKRGKSTLINTLLGQDNDNLSPVGTAVCTGVITHYMDLSCLPEKDEPHAKVYTYGDSEPKLVALNAIGDYIQESSNKDNWRNVARIEVYGNFPLLHSCCLVDTPGANAVFKRHGELVYDLLPQADAIIMTVLADQPVTTSEAKMLKALSVDTQRRIFYVLTQIDTQNPQFLPETCGHLINKIGQYGLQRPHTIYQVACKPVFEAQCNHLGEEETSALRSKWGVTQLEQDLERFILKTSVNGANLAKRIHEAVAKAKSSFLAKKHTNDEIIKAQDIDAQEVHQQKDRVLKEFRNLEDKLDKMIDNFEREWDRATEKIVHRLSRLQGCLEHRIKNVLDGADTVTSIQNSFQLAKIVNDCARDPIDDFMRKASDDYSKIVNSLDAEMKEEIDLFTRISVENSKLAQGGAAVVSAIAVAAAGTVATAGYAVLASTSLLATTTIGAGMSTFLGGLCSVIPTIVGFGSTGLTGWTIGSCFASAGAALPVLVLGAVAYKCTGPMAQYISELSIPGKVEEVIQQAEVYLKEKADADKETILKAIRDNIAGVRKELEGKLEELDNRIANMDPTLKEQALLENERLDNLLLEGQSTTEKALQLQ